MIFWNTQNMVGPGNGGSRNPGGEGSSSLGGLIIRLNYDLSYIQKSRIEPLDLVFSLNIRTLNTWLVGYGMNGMVTRLEVDRFKGFKALHFRNYPTGQTLKVNHKFFIDLVLAL